MYPALNWLTKTCSSPVNLKMPDGNSVSFEENSTIYIPVQSIHFDENIYENPLVFTPERFDSEHQGVKYFKEKCVFLSFGDGPSKIKFTLKFY